MVDISHKIPSRRSASATAFVLFSNPHPHACLTKKSLAKGDAIAVARIAGIQAAKKTADLIPLAHPGLGITRVQVDIELLDPSVENHDGYADVNLGEGGFEFGGVKITAHVSCDGKTGVEMEALTAANMAALTIYDMCKAVDKRMLITGVRVIMKRGGKGGHWSLDGQIPDDPPPSHVFEPVLQRRMAGIVDEAETHLPAEIPNPPSETAVANDLPPAVPEATADFLTAAAAELDLFIANTTFPTKAAEIAGLRRAHRALTAEIKTMQHRLEHGRPGPEGQEPLRDGRVSHDALQRLYDERRQCARDILAWRVGGGSQIKEAHASESARDEDEKENSAAEKAGAGAWMWKGGVFGYWPTHDPAASR